MRGDPPLGLDQSQGCIASTPHARGSTAIGIDRVMYEEVYPACAGIHRDTSLYIFILLRLPRMRGDPPQPLS